MSAFEIFEIFDSDWLRSAVFDGNLKIGETSSSVQFFKVY
jgi:hypothetical protein